MTRVVRYTDESPYRGFPLGRPMAQADITNPATGRSITRRVLVDSGADVSVVPLGGLASLGISTSQLQQVRSQGTAGGVDCYESELRFDVCGIAALARVLTPTTPIFSTYILGREPFFRLVHFGFAQFTGTSENRTMWLQAR